MTAPRRERQVRCQGPTGGGVNAPNETMCWPRVRGSPPRGGAGDYKALSLQGLVGPREHRALGWGTGPVGAAPRIVSNSGLHTASLLSSPDAIPSVAADGPPICRWPG